MTPTTAPTAPVDTPQVWNFRVLLDGDPIGQHRFTLSREADEPDDNNPRASASPPRRRLDSAADFRVKLLGLTVYRYSHRATEQWSGDCLSALDASTDDDGKPSRVRANRQADLLQVAASPAAPASGADPRPPRGCLMSFAYWNPALTSQSRLLNPQTGTIEAVRFSRLPPRSIEVRGRQVAVQGWRLQGASDPVDVWWTPQGEWVGLDAQVSGGRQLSYRLP